MQKYSKDMFPTAEMIKAEMKREQKKEQYQKYKKYILPAAAAVIILIVAVTMIAMPVVKVSGTGMQPTLNDKDVVIMKRTKEINRGDICRFKCSDGIMVGRVIGLPGDVVDISSSGTVSINGTELSEPYVMYSGSGVCDISLPCEVPQDKYFIMGDHRSTAIDSRSTAVGCVGEDQIKGKLIVRILPVKEFSSLD